MWGGEHIYRYCRFFCFTVSMPSAQPSWSSEDFFSSFHDTYQRKYHLSSSSSSCLSPGLSDLTHRPVYIAGLIFGAVSSSLRIPVARISWVVTGQEEVNPAYLARGSVFCLSSQIPKRKKFLSLWEASAGQTRLMTEPPAYAGSSSDQKPHSW